MHVQKSKTDEDKPFIAANLRRQQEEAGYRSRAASSATPPQQEEWTYARLSVLGVTCYFLLSAMMCDEVVGAAVPEIKNSMDLTSSEVGMLYSSSFVPSLVFVVLGGLLHHKIGVRALSLFSSICVVTGMIVFALSTTFWQMVLGRVLFGFGLGPTELVNDIISLRWFDNETVPSIEIAFGTIASFGMLGFVLAFNLMPLFLHLFAMHTEEESLRMAVLCLSVIPTITVVINIYYVILDWYAEPILELELESENSPSILDTVTQLPLSYWLLFTVNASCFALMYVIMLYSVDFMVEKWGYDPLTSGQFSSSVYIAGIIVSPITGIIIHKFGQMITLIFFGVVLFGVGCLVMGATPLHPLYGLLSIGVGLGMMETTLWTAVAEVVPETSFGPAFAFLSAAVSVVLVIVPYVAGSLHDAFDSYEPVAYLCAAGALLGGLCTIALYFIAPNLQNPSDKYKQYYVVKIVSRKKRTAPHRPRRHSITEGEVKQIVGYLTETDAFEDLHLDTTSDSTTTSDKPKLFDILWQGDNEKWHDTGSLPKDFFSKLVEHSATLVPIEEGHPAFEKATEDSSLIPSSAVQSELDKSTIDLEKIWDITAAKSPPKSRTISEAVKPIFKIPENLKSRAISDASNLDLKKTRKPTRTKSPEITKRKPAQPPPQQIPSSKKPLAFKIHPQEVKTTDDAEKEEVWTPASAGLEDEPRLRTTSDLTHTNWSKYGRIQTPPPSLSRIPHPATLQRAEGGAAAAPTTTTTTTTTSTSSSATQKEKK